MSLDLNKSKEERRIEYYRLHPEQTFRRVHRKRESKLIDKLICRLCKRTDLPLIKSSKTKNGGRYYVCNPCSNLAYKRYAATDHGKKMLARKRKIYYEKHREKVKARSILNHAIESGKIIKPNKCSICGRTGRIEGHHEDYTKPLEVIWFCPLHHRQYDSRMVI